MKESYNCWMNNCLCFHLLLLALKELLLQQNPALLLEAKYEILLSCDTHKIYVPSESCSEFALLLHWFLTIFTPWKYHSD